MPYRDTLPLRTFSARFSDGHGPMSASPSEETVRFMDRLLEAGIPWDDIKVTEHGGSSVHAYTVFYRHHQEIA